MVLNQYPSKALEKARFSLIFHPKSAIYQASSVGPDNRFFHPIGSSLVRTFSGSKSLVFQCVSMENHNPWFCLLNRCPSKVFSGLIDDIHFSSKKTIKKNGSKSMS